MKRIGIMGGTFDPIHYGHLLIAQSAMDELDLDRVVFLPTGKSPHKDADQVTAPQIRCELVQLAIADNPDFVLSRIEADNPSVNYTCKTLATLHRQYPDTQFFFVMGEDSLDDFHTWKNPDEICRLADILVAVRSHELGISISEKIQTVSRQYHGRIQALHAPFFSVSSSAIRERVRNKKSIRYMLPPAVEEKIRSLQLYISEK